MQTLCHSIISYLSNLRIFSYPV